MKRRTVPRLLIASGIWLVAFVNAQSNVPRREPVKMFFYREATGINAHIAGIGNDVTKFAEDYESAFKKKDSAEILGDMAENWAYSNERGESYPREQWVAERVDPNKGKNLIFPFFQHVDIEWHIFGDNTLVETGRSNSTLYYKGKVSHGPRRETAVYTKIDGKWVQAHFMWASFPRSSETSPFHRARSPMASKRRIRSPNRLSILSSRWRNTTKLLESTRV